jgi:hypothetical protein
MADPEGLCAFLELRLEELPTLPPKDAQLVKGLVTAYHADYKPGLTEHTLREVGAVFYHHVDYRQDWAPEEWA